MQQDTPDGSTLASQRSKQKHFQGPVKHRAVIKSVTSAKQESSFISKGVDLIVKADSEPGKKTKTKNLR